MRIELRELLFFIGLSLMFLTLLLNQRQLERQFYEHWHYTPKPVEDFYFNRARIFPDEKIPYALTKVKKQEPAYYYWSYTCGR